MDFKKSSLCGYINKIKEIEEYILDYLEEDHENDTDLENKDNQYQAIRTNKYSLKILLHIISHISNNYHRFPNFFSKIENILREFKLEMQKYFTNLEIFRIFEKNKRILLFLFEENFLIKEISILAIIHKKPNDYEKYLFPSNIDIDQEEFDKKRKIGENDSYICKLIRNDSIEEFIIYVNQTNISLNSRIKSSIFETNPIFFYKPKNPKKNKMPTLIEYATFYGSIQIFQYLRLNEVELTPSLWKYAIHSNNAEMIQLLEDLQVNPNSNIECLSESIKCHHLNLMRYLNDKYFPDDFFNYFGFHYYNMSYISIHSSDLIHNIFSLSLIYQCVKYDHIEIVELFLKINSDILNQVSVCF